MAAAAAIISRKNRYGGYNSSPYRSRSSFDEDDGPNACWLMIFAVCGVSLVGMGAWYAYDSFDDPRNVAILPYNRAVAAWNNEGRREFADSVFEWRLVSPRPQMVTIKGNCEDKEETTPKGCTKTHEVQQLKDVDPASSDAPWVPMVQAHIPEPLSRDQSMEGILPYEPLRWVGTGVLPASPPGHLERGEDGMNRWTGSKYKLQLRARSPGNDGKVAIFDIEEIEPMKEVPVAANTKMCRLHHGGNFHDQRCWDREAIAAVCLRLNYTSDGWKAPEGMSRGCVAGTELSFSRSCPGSSIMGRSQLSDEPGCDFSHVNFTLRSIDDPHTVAMTLTDGTLNFGYTPHENWVTGIVMMVVGGVLLCPLAPMCFVWVRNKRTSHSRYMASDSIFDRPSTSVYNRTTVRASPSPSIDSGATEEDYRIDIKSNSSRTESRSPGRRRRGASNDPPPPSGIRNAEYYGVQPGGQADLGDVDVEMQAVATQSPTHQAPRLHPAARNRI